MSYECCGNDGGRATAAETMTGSLRRLGNILKGLADFAIDNYPVAVSVIAVLATVLLVARGRRFFNVIP